MQRRQQQLSCAPCPTPSPLCGEDNDSSAACPALPHLLRVARTMTAQPCAPPCPISFVWRRQRQLSHTPCPTPSPSCSGGDNSSATRPALPHLLCAAAATTTQLRALPHPVSFVQWQRQQ